MTNFKSNEEFFAALKTLIDGWCEGRKLKPLSNILGPYLAFSGLTDSWSELREGLRTARAMSKDELSDDELETISDLIRACDRALDRKSAAT